MRYRVGAIMFALLGTAAFARADLQSDIRQIIAAPPMKNAAIGVQVVKLGQMRELDQTLVSINADEKLIPASNLKLITTAAAIDALGPDFEFRTKLLQKGDDLALIGDGDPMLGDTEALAGTEWGTTTLFDSWAKKLAALGVKTVRDLRIDDSIFDEQTFHPRWPTNQAHLDYVPQVSGLNLNANCLDVYAIANSNGIASYRIDPATRYVQVDNQVTVGSGHSLFLSRVLGGNRIILKGVINGTNRVPFRVTVHDPSMYTATVFAESLSRAGIRMTGKIVRDRTIRATTEDAGKPDGWTTIGINCTPLGRVLARTNKESINLYAEAIGKRLAAKRYGAPGSWETMPRALGEFMQKAGAGTNTTSFDDGCGLSKQNAVSPSAFCATLAYMFHGDQRDAYLQSMSVGGVDGTLSKRYRDGLAGRVQGKSGYVTGVSTLSGYVKSEAGEWFAFSILINKITSAAEAKDVQDKIVRAIDENAQ